MSPAPEPGLNRARLPATDVVLEGRAERVTAPDTLERLGPPPRNLYRIAVHTALGVATEPPYGASRWRLA